MVDLKVRRGQKDLICPQCETTITLKHGRFDSAAKGNKFEADVAAAISAALYDRPDVLRRTPTSGAMATFWPFDIYPAKVDEDKFQFGFECKNRENWDLEDLLRHKRSEHGGRRDTYILDWWDATVADSERYFEKFKLAKAPVLIFRKNRSRPLVLLESEVWKTLGRRVSARDELTDGNVTLVDFARFLEGLRKTYGSEKLV